MFETYCYYGSQQDCGYSISKCAWYSDVDPTTLDNYSDDQTYWKFDQNGKVVIW